jgi:hypothetical protein
MGRNALFHVLDFASRAPLSHDLDPQLQWCMRRELTLPVHKAWSSINIQVSVYVAECTPSGGLCCGWLVKAYGRKYRSETAKPAFLKFGSELANIQLYVQALSNFSGNLNQAIRAGTHDFMITVLALVTRSRFRIDTMWCQLAVSRPHGLRH